MNPSKQATRVYSMEGSPPHPVFNAPHQKTRHGPSLQSHVFNLG